MDADVDDHRVWLERLRQSILVLGNDAVVDSLVVGAWAKTEGNA